MMTLLFLLIFIAMLGIMLHRDRLAGYSIAAAFLLSLYWFNHHASSQLTIVL